MFLFFFLSFLIQVQENIQPYNAYSMEMRKHERKKNSVVIVVNVAYLYRLLCKLVAVLYIILYNLRTQITIFDLIFI